LLESDFVRPWKPACFPVLAHPWLRNFLGFGPRFTGSRSQRTLLQTPQRFGFSSVSATQTFPHCWQWQIRWLKTIFVGVMWHPLNRIRTILVEADADTTRKLRRNQSR